MRLWPAFRRPVILVVLLLILSGLTLLVESGWDAYRHHVRVNELSEVIDRIAIGDPVGSLDTITEPAQKLGASINRTEVSITFRITARVRLRPGGRDPFTDHRIVIGQGLVLAKEARSGVMHVLCCFGFDEPVYWPLIVRFHWLTLIGLGGIALWSLRGAFAATPPPRPPFSPPRFLTYQFARCATSPPALPARASTMSVHSRPGPASAARAAR